MRCKLFLRSVVLTGLLVSATPTNPAFSGCFREVSLAEITQDADSIIVGKIRSVKTVMAEMDGVDGLIPFQEIVIKVFDSWKGDSVLGDRITLRFPGGALPDGTMFTVSTSPAVEHHLDTPSLFFIDKGCFGEGGNGLCHKALGIYQVEKRKNGSAIVRGVVGHPVSRNRDLPELKAQVRAVVASSPNPGNESDAGGEGR